MVIRGGARGNGRQLSHYLLAMKDNEAIRILDVDGQLNPTPEDLHRNIFLMGVSAELSKSEKGLYHAQINPAIGEDKAMKDEAWLEAGDILGRQLGLANQRRAIVLHTKKGRTHAHVVWERYDHEKQKMVSDGFSRLAQDRARKEMELVFSHKKTPHRNQHRPELKASLSKLWQDTETGAAFITSAQKNGYLIATGSGRNPFMVVDERGRSYNLTRQIDGVRLKEIRQRLRNESLLGEKQAIEKMRSDANNATDKQKGSGKRQSSNRVKITKQQQEFSTSAEDMTAQNAHRQRHKHRYKAKATLTHLWDHSDTGADFLKAAYERGYMVAGGASGNPFVAIDENGNRYTLTRQFVGVRIEDIRQRLQNQMLLEEKDAISQVRFISKQKYQETQRSSSNSQKLKTMQEEFSGNQENITGQNERKQETVKQQQRQNKEDLGLQPKDKQPEQTAKEKLADSKQDITGQQPEQSTKDKFTENMTDKDVDIKKDKEADDREKEKERQRQEFRQRMKEMDERKQQNKDKGFDMG